VVRRATIAVPALAAALLGWQLFLPPVIGLADNSDFAKTAGLFSLRADRADAFVHFARLWPFDPSYYWDSGFRTTGHVHLWLARAISGGGAVFDMRWIGLTHAGVALAALALAASALGWRALLLIPLLLDFAYSAYFNSMFMDAASIVWLALALAALVTRREGVFAVACLAFVCSKSTHAIGGVLLCGAGFWVFRRWALLAVTLAASAWSLTRITPVYQGQAVYNLIFTKLAAHATDADILSLGVRQDELRWKNTTAFEPHVPAQDERWLREFSSRISHGDLVGLYLRHAAIPLRFAWNDLTVEAPNIRPVHLGNYERAAGQPLGGKAGGPLSAWSWIRSKTMLGVPLLFAWAAWWFTRRGQWLSIGGLAWLMAGAEFGIATLADACETSRHLILFHYLTDILTAYLLITFRQVRR